MTTFIPDESVAETIFNKLYLIAIPQLFRYSEQEMTEIGIHSSGKPEIDAVMNNTKFDLYASIPQMINYYNQGSPIWFSARPDIVEIYQLLIRHLEIWAHILKTQIGNIPPPLEDFMQMDDFARSILPLTRGIDVAQGALGLRGRLKGFNRGLVGLGGRIAQPIQPITNTTVQEKPLEHKSVIDELFYLMGEFGNEYPTDGH